MSLVLDRARDTLNERQVQLLADLQVLQSLGLISRDDLVHGEEVSGTVTSTGDAFLAQRRIRAAAALWRHEAVRARSPQSIIDNRTVKDFMTMAPEFRDRWLNEVDVVREALA